MSNITFVSLNTGPPHVPWSGQDLHIKWRPQTPSYVRTTWSTMMMIISSYQHIERLESRWLTFLGGETIMKSGLGLFTYNDTLPGLRICYSRLFLHPRPECPPWNYKIISKLTIKQGLVCHVSLSTLYPNGLKRMKQNNNKMCRVTKILCKVDNYLWNVSSA